LCGDSRGRGPFSCPRSRDLRRPGRFLLFVAVGASGDRAPRSTAGAVEGRRSDLETTRSGARSRVEVGEKLRNVSAAFLVMPVQICLGTHTSENDYCTLEAARAHLSLLSSIEKNTRSPGTVCRAWAAPFPCRFGTVGVDGDRCARMKLVAAARLWKNRWRRSVAGASSIGSRHDDDRSPGPRTQVRQSPGAAGLKPSLKRRQPRRIVVKCRSGSQTAGGCDG